MKLAIAVPTLDYIPALFSFDLARLYAETCMAFPYQVTLAPGLGFVHQAREKLLHDVTELWGATHILWLDADMTFPRDAALRLLKHDKEVVAANYVTRRPPHRPTARSLSPKDGQWVSSADSTGLGIVAHVGMGVFLMKTSVLEGLPRPRFWYSTPTETEDVYFCNLLRKAGHEIWIDHDLSKEVSHVGTHPYREVATPVTGMTDVPIFRRFYLPDAERVEIMTDWPDETIATREFVKTALPEWVQRRGRTLSFTLSNGSAAYRIASRDVATDTYLLKRVG